MPILAWVALAAIAVAGLQSVQGVVDEVGDTAKNDLLPIAALGLVAFVVLKDQLRG